jgi:hypothetical protein
MSLMSHTHALEYPDVNVIRLDHFFAPDNVAAHLKASVSTSCDGTHTHHFQCCQATVDLTWTVLHPQQLKQRPFLLAANRQFIQRQEQRYTRTQKMMATNRVA